MLNLKNSKILISHLENIEKIKENNIKGKTKRKGIWRKTKWEEEEL
jgi:hypothetical protein